MRFVVVRCFPCDGFTSFFFLRQKHFESETHRHRLQSSGERTQDVVPGIYWSHSPSFGGVTASCSPITSGTHPILLSLRVSLGLAVLINHHKVWLAGLKGFELRQSPGGVLRKPSSLQMIQKHCSFYFPPPL